MADSMKYVGQALPKVDSLARLTGIAQYSDDMPLPPRTAHAMLVHSPYAHARIRSIDSTKTEAVPGVIAVLDYRRDDMRFRWFSGDRAYERLLFNQELGRYGYDQLFGGRVGQPKYRAHWPGRARRRRGRAAKAHRGRRPAAQGQ